MNETLSNAQTWGLRLVESTNGRFLILPPGTTFETGYKTGNREAAKLTRR
jgi:hypothetical protein